jgi:unsaturated chondroitin disaccharide hydrolase
MNEKWVDEAWNYALNKLSITHKRIGATFPNASFDGRYDARELQCWTNGFWPGILWLAYRATGAESYRLLAENCEAQLDGPLHEYEQLHHDNGFLWSLSAVAGYKLTGNLLSRRRGLIAASHLASRYNLKGRFIRAWLYEGSEGLAIIDCMMNLGLLYWASNELGDPRYRHIAMAHSEMALKEFIRPDGSVHHIIRFDPESGERLEALGGQGYSPDSAWSRGSAWAIYGFAIGYRYTGEARYLKAARAAADYFMDQLPEDKVPPWDFRAPAGDLWAKDSTAAACAASGMLEIAQALEGEAAQLYRQHGAEIAESLYRHYTPEDPSEEALILKGTASFPAGAEVEVPIIYGDYFFLEALTKLKGSTEIFW